MDFPDNEVKFWQLAEKWINGTITPSEEVEFSVWYNANQGNMVMLPGAFAGNEEILKKRILQNIQQRKAKVNRETTVHRYSIIKMTAVAAVFMILSAGAWYYFNQKREARGLTKHNTDTDQLKNDLTPGCDKAVLTLADGSKIVLDNTQNGALIQQGNTKLVIVNAGQLAYNQHGIINNNEVLYNTISTPKGGQYQVILPDGTKVWLNAVSSLRFPTAFTGTKRNVELTGEAYFEVMPLARGGGQKMPFIVQVNSPSKDGDMHVEVLGTHFNIMAYNDETAVKTTLLEGAVKVTKGMNTGLLKPGKQAYMDKNAGSIKVSDADPEEAVAWKNGLFQFNNEEIKIIMRQIARWYDAEISFEGNISNRDFTGQFRRNSNISQMLKKFEATGSVHFKVDGKKIVVMP